MSDFFEAKLRRAPVARDFGLTILACEEGWHTITNVESGGEGEKAGLAVGDRICEVDGKPLPRKLHSIVNYLPARDSTGYVNLGVRRPTPDTKTGDAPTTSGAGADNAEAKPAESAPSKSGAEAKTDETKPVVETKAAEAKAAAEAKVAEAKATAEKAKAVGNGLVGGIVGGAADLAKKGGGVVLDGAKGAANKAEAEAKVAAAKVATAKAAGQGEEEEIIVHTSEGEVRAKPGAGAAETSEARTAEAQKQGAATTGSKEGESQGKAAEKEAKTAKAENNLSKTIANGIHLPKGAESLLCGLCASPRKNKSGTNGKSSPLGPSA